MQDFDSYIAAVPGSVYTRDNNLTPDDIHNIRNEVVTDQYQLALDQVRVCNPLL